MFGFISKLDPERHDRFPTGGASDERECDGEHNLFLQPCNFSIIGNDLGDGGEIEANGLKIRARSGRDITEIRREARG